MLAALGIEIRVRYFQFSLALRDICPSVGYPIPKRKSQLWHGLKDFQKKKTIQNFEVQYGRRYEYESSSFTIELVGDREVPQKGANQYSLRVYVSCFRLALVERDVTVSVLSPMPMIKRPLGTDVNHFQKTAGKIFSLYMSEDLNGNKNAFLKRYLEIDEGTVVLASFDSDLLLRSFPVLLALIDI